MNNDMISATIASCHQEMTRLTTRRNTSSAKVLINQICYLTIPYEDSLSSLILHLLTCVYSILCVYSTIQLLAPLNSFLLRRMGETSPRGLRSDKIFSNSAAETNSLKTNRDMENERNNILNTAFESFSSDYHHEGENILSQVETNRQIA